MEIQPINDRIFRLCREGTLDEQHLETETDVTSLRDEEGLSLLDVAIVYKRGRLANMLRNFDFVSEMITRYRPRYGPEWDSALMTMYWSRFITLAARSGCLADVRSIVHLYSPNMDSALREACENGHAASAKWLIFAGADDYGHLESAFINQLLLDGPTRPDGPIRRRVDLRDIFAMLVQRRVYPRYGISNFWENLGAFTSPSYITFIVEKIIHNGMQLVQMLRGACRTGNTANVAFLIYYAQMYEAKSNKPIELDPLAMCHIARVGGHNHLIAPLLDGYEGPDSPALLLCAAAGGLLATVQAVLERKPGAVRRYPVRGFGSSTALSVADDPAVISALLAAGAEVNPVRCESTLRAACVGYRPESVRRLLAAGVDVNRTNYVEGVLELAITSPCAADRAEDKAEVIRLLLDAGATVVLDPGMTLGHLCVAQDRFTQPAVALRTILRHRPLLFSDNLLHNPQLMVLAVRQRNPAVVQALVDAGLSVHVLDTDGKPLIWCLLEQPLEAYGDAAAMREILDILLRAGADPTACDMQGQSLVMAIVEGVFGDVGRFAFYAIIDAILSKL